MSNNTDGDDISAFVQYIDARKPLRRTLSDRRTYPAVRTNSEPSGAGVTGIREPMLTNISDIDQRLKEMNDTFTARLARLSGTPPSPRVGGGAREGFGSRDRTGPRERSLTRGPVLPEIYDPLLVVGGLRMRSRHNSMGSVRSGLSICSEEVIEKLGLDKKGKSKGA